jgi:hypothetical protein
MKEHPIIFSGPMVQAILDGRKSVTRRVIKPQPPSWITHGRYRCFGATDDLPWELCSDEGASAGFVRCPYGKPGDRLWVRETWAIAYWEGAEYQVDYGTGIEHDAWPVSYDGSLAELAQNPPPDWHIVYRAECATSAEIETFKWRPSIHMPRWASRITLEVIGIRVERVQDITEPDAIAEGVGYGYQMNAGWPDYGHIEDGICTLTQDTAVMSFATLWDSINAKRGYSWDSDPWVWVVEFELEI